MRSPEAVFELSAYHEAPPHPFPAKLSEGSIEEHAAIVAAVAIERQIFFKTDFPSKVMSAPLLAAALKSVEKWRKSASEDHGLLHFVIIVSATNTKLYLRKNLNMEKR
ncbi:MULTISPECIES: hypothetical protein [unclassified Sinorhizobium]|uniref:hypothetical protein n=1 Tax=unclassified Sinorhizobium TaxID=2613772 RepID=UPI00352476C0